jgi:hypothetical protein
MLYAFFMGWPEQKTLNFAALATSRPYVAGKVEHVKILGGGKPKWTHNTNGLSVQLPEKKPCDYGCVLKIEGLAT